MIIKKDDIQEKWKQLFAHKKAMEERFRLFENTNIYAQFG